MKKLILIFLLFTLCACSQQDMVLLPDIVEEQAPVKMIENPIEPIKIDNQLILTDLMSNEDYFDNAVFIGDSRFIDIINYEAFDNAYLLAEVSMAINKVNTHPIKSNIADGSFLITEWLDQKQFDIIYLSFGLNELLWEYPEMFIEQYDSLVKAIKEKQPDSDIVILLLYPFGITKLNKNDGMTNQRVAEYNILIEQMAIDNDVYYYNQYDALLDDNGVLRDEITEDGIHLTSDGYQIWADLLRHSTVEVNYEKAN